MVTGRVTLPPGQEGGQPPILDEMGLTLVHHVPYEFQAAMGSDVTEEDGYLDGSHLYLLSPIGRIV